MGAHRRQDAAEGEAGGRGSPVPKTHAGVAQRRSLTPEAQRSPRGTRGGAGRHRRAPAPRRGGERGRGAGVTGAQSPRRRGPEARSHPRGTEVTERDAGRSGKAPVRTGAKTRRGARPGVSGATGAQNPRRRGPEAQSHPRGTGVTERDAGRSRKAPARTGAKTRRGARPGRGGHRHPKPTPAWPRGAVSPQRHRGHRGVVPGWRVAEARRSGPPQASLGWPSRSCPARPLTVPAPSPPPRAAAAGRGGSGWRR